MARPWEFRLPTEIHFGRGVRKRMGKVAAEWGQRALLVGYRQCTPLEGPFCEAAENLAAAGLAVETFCELEGEPDWRLPLIGAERARGFAADVVVGLGGGSVLDLAKGIALLAKTGGQPWDYAGANRRGKPADEALPIVALPTTAGTGAEVTGVAVFTFEGKGATPETPLKASIGGPALRPRAALVDSELAESCLPRWTAACGVDALAHAIEAHISRGANPLASTLALKAVGLLNHHLSAVAGGRAGAEEWDAVALAATLAGAAFNEAGVTVTHALAHALGAILDVPHGEAIALGTPLNLHFNAGSAAAPLAELADVCGIASADTPQAERAAAFVDHVVALLRGLGLPDRVEVESPPSEELLEKLARNATAGTVVAVAMNPRRVQHATLVDLFRQLVKEGNPENM